MRAAWAVYCARLAHMLRDPVFVVYSQRDRWWREQLQRHLKPFVSHEWELEAWDDTRIKQGGDRKKEISVTLQRAKVAVLLVSPNFLASDFIIDEVLPPLLNAAKHEGLCILWIAVSTSGVRATPLNQYQAAHDPSTALDQYSEAELNKQLVAIAEKIKDAMSAPRPTVSQQVAALPTNLIGEIPPHQPPQDEGTRSVISIAKLPSSHELLLGREAELQKLTEAWSSATPKRVFAIIAWGGTGKTALVNHWLAEQAKINYGGVRRVLAWSFYNQGTSGECAASSDEFIAWALRSLGCVNPDTASPIDRAVRLAALLRAERTLLILDGVEPLQHPPGPDQGKLRDRALAALLRELCAYSFGLCIVTSRLRLVDLGAFEGKTSETLDLSQLGAAAGSALLRKLGVHGTDAEVTQAVIDFGGHALALTLLGQYLKDRYEGEVWRRSEIGPLEGDDGDDVSGAHARRVMASYEAWFQKGPERDILNLLGLFDRPATKSALVAVRPPNLNQRAWTLAVARLRRARLIEKENPQEPGSLDAHPLVREHFGEMLKKNNLAAWHEGNRLLYLYYKSVPKEYPNTIEELSPLYAAVYHGCRAELHPEALEEVYWRRICRRDEIYAVHKLGAFDADLAALAGFFETLWTVPVSTLNGKERAFVWGNSGFRLRAVGRLRDAIEPTNAGLAARQALEDWQDAARLASNLSELYLALGDMDQALSYATHGVELADRSRDAFQRMGKRTTLADVLHQAGHIEEAKLQFIEAEAIQQKLQPDCPLLSEISGYRYCDFLLECNAAVEVYDRVQRTLGWKEREKPRYPILGIALEHLALGRARLALVRAGDSAQTAAASDDLDKALSGLRRAGYQHFLLSGLLARADFFIFEEMISRAHTDLDEALAIAERGEMRLYEADAQLGIAALNLAKGDRAGAECARSKAEKIITTIGYNRRRILLDEIRSRILTHA